MTKRVQPGYYPGYSTLGQKGYWDEATRHVVLDRVLNVPKIQFFDERELKLIEAVVAHIIPQDDRDELRRIPIVPWLDKHLKEKRLPGYRFAEMPPEDEAYRLALEAIDLMAVETYHRGFLDLDMHEQDVLLRSIHDGKPCGAKAIWEKMPVHRFWQMLVQDCIEVYYAHPWAWDEIGYGGPAYPRAYMRFTNGEPEPWEKPEQRYEWEAPSWAVSDVYEPSPGIEGQAHFGQEGTH